MNAFDIIIPCRTCGGSGRVSLPLHLIVTLNALSESDSLATIEVQAVLNRGGVGGDYGCIINRLSALRELGLASREGLKRSYRWRRVPQQSEQAGVPSSRGGQGDG